MSTGLQCALVEYEPGQWYYALQSWSCPVGAWDWRDHADVVGPFPSDTAALDHLHAHHANPGGYEIDEYSEERHRTWEPFVRLAVRP